LTEAKLYVIVMTLQDKLQWDFPEKVMKFKLTCGLLYHCLWLNVNRINLFLFSFQSRLIR